MARPCVGLAHGLIGEAPDAYTDAGLAAVVALVARAVAGCCDLPTLVRGRSVLLKPNLVRPNPHNPRSVVTDERVILAMVRLVRQAGATVAIANRLAVLHVRGVSSRARPFFVEWHKHRGLWRYFRKFEAPRRGLPVRAAVWCAIWAHALVQVPRLLLHR